MASGGVRQASFEEKNLGLEIYEYKRAHTLDECPLGRPLEAKFLQELIVAFR